MREYIVFNNNLKPSCCRAMACTGREIKEKAAYYWEQDGNFMCENCFNPKAVWSEGAEKVIFTRQEADFSFSNCFREELR